jgi:hypothetical protein
MTGMETGCLFEFPAGAMGQEDACPPDMELAPAGQLCYNRPVWVPAVIDRIEEDDAKRRTLHTTAVFWPVIETLRFSSEEYKMYVLKIVRSPLPSGIGRVRTTSSSVLRVPRKSPGPGGSARKAAIATRPATLLERAYRSKDVAMSSLGDAHRNGSRGPRQILGGSIDTSAWRLSGRY